jgi:hypothetical protein
MEPQLFLTELTALQQEQHNLTTALANLAEAVAAMRVLVAQSQAAAAAEAGNADLAAAAGKQLENMQQVVARLVGHFERLRVVKVELQRRAIMQDFVAGSGAARWAKRMQKLRAGLAAQQQQQQQPEQQQREEWRQAFRMCPRDLQQQLEASYIADVSVLTALGLCRFAMHNTIGCFDINMLLIYAGISRTTVQLHMSDVCLYSYLCVFKCCTSCALELPRVCCYVLRRRTG